MSKRRARFAAGGLAVVAVLAGLLSLAQQSVSPEQRIAQAEPPPPAVVDLELEKRRLEDSVLVRGRVAVESKLEVIAPSTGGGDGTSTSVPIVVSLPYGVGEEIPPGAVVAVVSDRPLIVLPMAVPMHRSLQPGDEGPDVERLQQALAELGYDVSHDGEFGPGTQRVVRRLYEDRGFEPPVTAAELEDAVTAAQQSRDAARAEVSAAESAWNSAVTSGDEAALSAAQQNLDAARGALTESEGALAEAESKVGVVAPLGELVGVGEFPLVVSKLPVGVGKPVTDGSVVVLSPSEFVVEVQLDEVRSAILQPGMRGVATIEGEDTSFDVEIVEQGGVEPGAAEETAAAPMVMAPLSRLDPNLLSKPVVVEVELSASEGEVLAVPVGAVRSDADGEYLTLVGDDGTTRRVGFTAAASIGGWVEVTDPEVPLEPGDVVRAG